MKHQMTFALAMFCSVLPKALKFPIYRRVFKWDIHQTAHIGMSIIYARKVELCAHAHIGRFNVIRNLELLSLGTNATIGNRNYVSALPLNSKRHFEDNPNRQAALVLKSDASITGRHIFDCNDTITIGDFALIAGRDSMFYTHGVDIVTNRQMSAPIIIGNYSMVGARCVILKGATLPEKSILAAQSVLNKPYTEGCILYSGTPAIAGKELPKNAAFFSRKEGPVN